MSTLEESFERDFDCEQLQELPHDDTQTRFYYPGATTMGGQDGLIVRVRPHEGGSWVGVFAFGKLLPKGKNGLYSWPDPKVLCVVSRGQGYTVQVDEPSKYQLLDVHPILGVFSIPGERIVVFSNYTELVAYGKSGIAWVSERLSGDGFTVNSVSDTHIEGGTWDPRMDRDVRFRVDLRNGHHELLQ